MSSPSVPSRPGDRAGVADAGAAGALFGSASLAWRFGAGPALVVGTARLLAGGLLLAPLVWRSSRQDGFRSCRPVWAKAAIAVGTLGMLLPPLVFRLVPLPWQLAMVAVQPAGVALAAAGVRGRRPTGRALALSFVCCALALAAQPGGARPRHPAVLLAVAGMLVTEALRSAFTQKAVDAGASAAAVSTLPPVLAAPLMAGLALAHGDPLVLTPAAVAAATAVAVAGTLGRFKQARALGRLPAVSVTALCNATQLLVMAVGGPLLFGDRLRLTAVLLLAAASAAGLAAAAQRSHP